ncbi:MAG: TIGR02646 family protein [Blastocatellia bacterium]
MRNIVKGPEPQSLKDHRRAANADYDNYTAKQDLRQAIVREQRGLCCYCMSRISADRDRVKIEHWQSQATFPEHQMVYANLLGACPGGEGNPDHQQHCDTRKGKSLLSMNPADPAHDVERTLLFDRDGTIRSSDPAFDCEINEVLNLNGAPRLKANRKAVLTGFLRAKPKDGKWKESQVRKWLAEWNGESTEGDLKPYCQVAVYWLRKRLDKNL